jgi:hypothetical protein
MRMMKRHARLLDVTLAALDVKEPFLGGHKIGHTHYATRIGSTVVKR